MKNNEIAEKLSMTENNVRVTHHTACKAIAKALNQSAAFESLDYVRLQLSLGEA